MKELLYSLSLQRNFLCRNLQESNEHATSLPDCNKWHKSFVPRYTGQLQPSTASCLISLVIWWHFWNFESYHSEIWWRVIQRRMRRGEWCTLFLMSVLLFSFLFLPLSVMIIITSSADQVLPVSERDNSILNALLLSMKICMGSCYLAQRNHEWSPRKKTLFFPVRIPLLHRCDVHSLGKLTELEYILCGLINYWIKEWAYSQSRVIYEASQLPASKKI